MDELTPRVEVLEDMEEQVRELMQRHESKRKLWFPNDIFTPADTESEEHWRAALRTRAEGISDPARLAIALNLLTEEALPHFHRLIATRLDEDSFWQEWNNLWTAEEDRHGVVLHDYCRASAILHAPSLERLRFAYLRNGFRPRYDKDPYKVFVYTTLQERATQIAHARTGRVAGEFEPQIDEILGKVASDEARHYAFYRQVFAEVLKRDPNRALEAAAEVMTAFDMPGTGIPGFSDLADVVRRAGIYGPSDYLQIVEDQIHFWKIESLTGLNEAGEQAQARILAIPGKLRNVLRYLERRGTPREFSFEILFGRRFRMD